MKFLPPYFSPCLPVVITAPGVYITRSGERVQVTHCVGRYATGYYSSDTPERWHNSGRIFPVTDTANDILSPATIESKP